MNLAPMAWNNRGAARQRPVLRFMTFALLALLLVLLLSAATLSRSLP